MKLVRQFHLWNIALALTAATATLLATDSIVLQLQTTNETAILQWRSQANLPVSGTLLQYEVEASQDLANWQRLGEFVSGRVGVNDETIRQAYPRTPQNSFFRITARTAIAPAGKFGDSIYGYSAAFNDQIQTLGQLPLETFVQLYNPTNEYRAAITFDPTTAEFWPAFNMDPAVYNATNTTGSPRSADFRMNEQEFALFKTNGYVVSPRLGSSSFGDALYRVFTNDLPVFISTDALLQAWHRTYVVMLNEIEEAYLAPNLNLILSNMLAQVDTLHSQAQGTPLAPSVRDADFFLAVANSLATGETNYGWLGQTNEINHALNSVAAQKIEPLELFGTTRLIDFSQFKPRGQYESSTNMQHYFRAMMWCALIDFQFTGPEDTNGLRQFSSAVALDLLLERSGSRDLWLQNDQLIRGFVGLPDCLNIAQLHDLATAAGIAPPFDQIPAAYQRLWTGDLGVQHIRSGLLEVPLGPEKLKLPRSFSFLPQRFTIDSWSFSKVVFDDIIWDENGIPDFTDKVPRRIPSGLDTAFAVFGNNQIVPEIAARIADQNGLNFRDGLPYQHNLAAVRSVIDGQQSAFWTNNLYLAWLNCLRTLSEPTTGPQFAQAFQTRAWALNSVNTQLASWTELRHDTILYVKQSASGMVTCSYPDAYVEPRPAFWTALEQLANRARDLIDTMPGGSTTVRLNYRDYTADFVKSNRLAVLSRIATAAATLRGISEKELANVELASDEIEFLQNTIEMIRTYNSGIKTWSGWYPKLFYRLPVGMEPEINQDAGTWDAMVTDVHTDPIDLFHGDPGCILHEAVGNVHMAFLAVDSGDRPPRMFAGPVFSYFEFSTPLEERKTDSEWKADLKAGNLPPPPPWTQSFLAPGTYTLPSNIY